MLFIILIILGLTLTIFVHELGHFIMARRAGIKVETFSIGMGPRLFVLRTDSSGTEYILSMIPVGGYVKMKGQEDLPKKTEENDTVESSTPDHDSYTAKSPLARMSVIVAGVIMNTVFAFFLLMTALIIGIPFESNRLGGVRPFSPAAAAGFIRGDEITAVNGNPTETFEDYMTHIALTSGKSPVEIQYTRNGETLVTAIQSEDDDKTSPSDFYDAGFLPWNRAVFADFEISEPLYMKGIRKGTIIEQVRIKNAVRNTISGIIQIIHQNPGDEIELDIRDSADAPIRTVRTTVGRRDIPEKGFMTRAVIDVRPLFPAAAAGLQNGDEILTINDNTVKGWEDVYQSFISYTGKGPVRTEFKRKGKTISVPVFPLYDTSEERYLAGISPSVSDANKSREITHVEPFITGISGSFQPGDTLVLFHEKNGGLEYTYMRGAKRHSFTVPAAHRVMKPAGWIGALAPEGKIIRYSLPVAFVKSFPRIGREFNEVVSGLKKLVTGKLSPKMMGGPIKIIDFTYQVGNTKGLAYFILIFVKIGISLAVINILPIPVLDGGHIVLISYELIRKRPPPVKLVFALQTAGFILIIFMFIFVMFNDINSVFLK